MLVAVFLCQCSDAGCSVLVAVTQPVGLCAMPTNLSHMNVAVRDLHELGGLHLPFFKWFTVTRLQMTGFREPS